MLLGWAGCVREGRLSYRWGCTVHFVQIRPFTTTMGAEAPTTARWSEPIVHWVTWKPSRELEEAYRRNNCGAICWQGCQPLGTSQRIARPLCSRKRNATWNRSKLSVRHNATRRDNHLECSHLVMRGRPCVSRAINQLYPEKELPWLNTVYIPTTQHATQQQHGDEGWEEVGSGERQAAGREMGRTGPVPVVTPALVPMPIPARAHASAMQSPMCFQSCRGTKFRDQSALDHGPHCTVLCDPC